MTIEETEPITKLLTLLPHHLWLVKRGEKWYVSRQGVWDITATDRIRPNHILLLPFYFICSIVTWPWTSPSLVYDMDKGELERDRCG